jgi:D-lactate dehydrogenase
MDLKRQLSSILDPKRVLTRWIDRIAFANDASVYRLVPRAVVLPTSIAEVQALFRLSRQLRLPLTFRAAGTSLSGQAVTDGILAVLSRHWRGVTVLDEGKRVRVQPGIIGDVVNQHLRPYRAKIGPDPASINACMMGGILANNSSGMCCGVVQNAYHTLESIRFVLPDGMELDTSRDDADVRLQRDNPSLAEGLLALKRRIEADTALTERIRSKYRMKNTTGYSLNALLDYSRPVDILAHLMIGSEGTLGFIAEAVLNTVPDYPEKYTGLLFFEGVPQTCSTIAALRDSGARALELMDRPSLRSIQHEPGVPERIRDLPPAAAALLVEYQCENKEELRQQIADCEALLPSLPLYSEPTFTRDPKRQAALWRVRKGLIPSVGAMRARGTSFIIEDVVFPVERLARGVAELQALFAEYDYDDAIVFGHAKDGNLHFVLTQAFQQTGDVERYDGFMKALAELVAGRHGGALKAEHGTGRNMAPFVAQEWGAEAYRIMRALKRLVDPDGLLNPGVVINDDPNAHVTDLKALPTVESEVDQCIECGFCERMCPSRDLTLTPRQRIVVRREMARLRELEPDSPRLRELERDYRYAAVDTCAADGMCALACPVGIDTGALVKRLRCEGHSETVQEIAAQVACRFGLVERAARISLRTGHLLQSWFGSSAVSALSRAAGSVLGGAVPSWDSTLPRAASGALPATSRAGAAAVYFPSCVSRVLGCADGESADPPLPDVLLRVARRAGLDLWIPDEVSEHCCGMPFSSKGFSRAHRLAAARMLEALWHWTDAGRLPVVSDSSPCTFTLKQAPVDLGAPANERYARLQILDGIEFAHEQILPRLGPRRRRGRVVLHPVCSVHKMELVGKLEAVARVYAAAADVPIAAGCCGFAGDRGFRFPELSRAALQPEAIEVRARAYDGYYCSSRTCEIGLTRATGKPYRSLWHLLDQATG